MAQGQGPGLYMDNPNYGNGDEPLGLDNLGGGDASETSSVNTVTTTASASSARVMTSDMYRRELERRGRGRTSSIDEDDTTGYHNQSVRRQNGAFTKFLSNFWRFFCLCFIWIKFWKNKKEFKSREIFLNPGGQCGQPLQNQKEEKYTPNIIKNQKYNIFTFFPLALYNQFKIFLNLYFLVMACSQFIPDIRIGYWYTYWGPLIFVVSVTLIREAIDDLRRRERDMEINNQKYLKLNRPSPQARANGFNSTFAFPHTTLTTSKNIKVGDLIIIEKDQRIPADMVLLRVSADRNSTAPIRCFIRTDQLDGETDWKLRLPILQNEVNEDAELFNMNVSIYAERPQMDIHSFVGTITKYHHGEDDEPQPPEELGISLENTLWANTVLASGNAVGLVIYTGSETRSVMNNSIPRSKFGLIDREINNLTKILFTAVAGLAFLMMMLKGWAGPWYRYMIRFILLFSYIIPISLRVNLDMGKIFYSWTIQRDKRIPGTVVRSTTIPEDLGRVAYLLTDKTGTLTQNEMIFKRLCHATSSTDSAEEIRNRLQEGLRIMLENPNQPLGPPPSVGSSYVSPTTTTAIIETTDSISSASASRNFQFKSSPTTNKNIMVRSPHNEISRIVDAIKALGVCHNVTPVNEQADVGASYDIDAEEQGYGMERDANYQASSPDEIALVKFAKECGLSLSHRDQSEMTLISYDPPMTLKYKILHIFPFTSEAKRMGLIVKDNKTGEIIFYLKGADNIMKLFVKENDWVDEAVGNMSREGLRTLVVTKKVLSQDQYKDFDRAYEQAKTSKSAQERNLQMSAAVENYLEKDLETVCVTGVEDTLQKDVKATLETLRTAGIKIWMLTGDKLETAICIAKSSKLVATHQEPYIFKDINDRSEAFSELNLFQRKNDSSPLVIKGESLEVVLKYYEKEFMDLACNSPVVVVCRCSPTQKAQVVELVKKVTKKVTAAIGDGGNDVAMIQQADVGVGIEGKEGRQASLAADFSIAQFSYIASLLLVHGRYSYKRSASLSQFVMHRGLIITVMQAVFSSIFYFSSVALYQGFMMIGYATVYTQFPVFALVLDKDVKEENLLRLPELYADLGKGRSLTHKTFFLWVLISVYQGGVIMYGALILFQDEFIHIVSISFTALILTELIMVALTIRNMHRLMIVAEIISIIFYLLSLVIFHQFFDINFIMSLGFLWKTSVITVVSCLPIYIAKCMIHKYIAPPNYSKLN